MINRSNIIGANVRKFRISKHLTQEQLAARLQLSGCDVSRSTLAKIEAGLRNISLEEINAIKSVLNMSYDNFFLDK